MLGLWRSGLIWEAASLPWRLASVSPRAHSSATGSASRRRFSNPWLVLGDRPRSRRYHRFMPWSRSLPTNSLRHLTEVDGAELPPPLVFSHDTPGEESYMNRNLVLTALARSPQPRAAPQPAPPETPAAALNEARLPCPK